MRKKAVVAVAGLGLIGGSLARALSARDHRVLGVDRDAVVRAARKAGAIAAGVSLENAAGEADILVLAAPPAANLRLLKRLAKLAAPTLVVTDVTSVKGAVVAEAKRLGLRHFVGGHPMAGTERSGFAASRADLFQGRPWIVTSGADLAAERVVRALAREAGARPVSLSAEDHDRFVALVSHVPQIVSWALLSAATRDPVGRRNLSLAGPGFHDMTRLARSPKRLWREILRGNAREVRRALAALQRALSRGGLWG
jgi:prephenate dehydrogenase